MLSSWTLALLASSLIVSVSASPHAHVRRVHNSVNHHKRAAHAARDPGLNPPLLNTTTNPRKRSSAKRCAKKSSSLLSATSSAAHSATAAPAGVGAQPTSATSSAKPAKATTPTPAKSDDDDNNSDGAVGAPVKPANWPTKTQAAATYSATAATSADPMLLGVSEALNNKGNSLFTQTHTGDLTYYGQGLGACGDTYDDSTYTAAVSHLLYDSWPGTTAETNRSPICGPYVPGRQTMNAVTGIFEMSLKSSVGSIMIGGDGLPNCDPAAGKQCHIPLTATIHNSATGKSVVVKIVDRCADCAIGDIDVTPTTFATIADKDLGRVSGITWKFNQF